MSTDVPVANKKFSLDTWAVLLSSILIPFPLLVGNVVEAILDTANPAGVDVAQPLAYLSQILGISFGSLGVLLVVIVVVFIVIYRRAGTLDALKLPLLVLATQIVIGGVILLLTAIIDNAGG
jgi:hypothetical protein